MSKKLLINIAIVILCLAANAFAQTSSFVYQGKLNDGALVANGTYQFEFKLYDSSSVNSGNQIGGTLSNVTATVANGIFSVNLDFGANSFDGAARFLEIAVRLENSGQNFTMLSPRQPITATPYAVKSLKSNEANTALTANDAANLGSIPAAQYVQTTDSRMTDSRNPLAFSGYYIQNGISPQTSSNFNISGEGKANLFSALTQYNIGAKRVLSVGGTGNIFAGIEAGNSNSTGGYNAFFGTSAGAANTTGGDNAFFGQGAGFKNSGGFQNTAAGSGAGLNNTNGSRNTFLGQTAGLSNTSENDNTFIGYKTNGAVGITNATAIGANAVVTTSNTMALGTNDVTVFAPGSFNTTSNYKIGGNRVFHLTGTDNAFIGVEAGNSITTGSFNAFFGKETGKKTTTGTNNAFFGAYTGRANIVGTNNAFFGANVGISNLANFNSFFGSAAGFTNLNGTGNSYFGALSGASNENGQNNSYFGYKSGDATTGGNFNTIVGGLSGIPGGNAGNYNVIIGYNSKIAPGISGAIVIGSLIEATSPEDVIIGSASNKVKLGRVFAASIQTNTFSTTNGNFSGNVDISGKLDVTGLTKTGDIESSGTIFGTKLSSPLVQTNNLKSTGAEMSGITTISKLKYINPDSGGTGTDYMCIDEYNDILRRCFAAISAKNNPQDFSGGLSIIKSFRAVTFRTDDGKQDVGLISNETNPNALFISRKENGEQKVRYNQVIPALVSATQEQQTQISDLKDLIKQQQAQIDALKALICSQNPSAAVCRTPNK